MPQALLTIILSIMVSLAPPGRRAYVPEAEETVEEATQRYAEIAESAYDAAFDPNESPILGDRIYTLALLLALSYHESGWRKDVDTGEGRARLSRKGWNDYGRSWCLCQIMLGKKGDDSVATTSEGWTGLDLLEDRRKCFRAALHIVHKSACSRGAGFLNAYATGTCGKGLEKSRARMATAQRIYSRIRQQPIQ